jgi:uncharacterized protein YfiM (DUF2279 family)
VPMARRLTRWVTVAAGVAVLLVLFAAAALLETAPRVTARPVADAGAAALTRDLLRDLQTVARNGAGAEGLQLGEAAINGALVAGARVVPGLAAEAEVGAAGVAVAGSWPLLGERLWLNGRAEVAASERGLAVSEVRLGRLSLPPGLVVAAARLAGDLVLGDRLASQALASIVAVRTDPPNVTVAFELSDADRERIGERARQALSRLAGSGDRERIYVHLWYLARAAEAGDLPGEGSVLPYLRFVVEKAHALAEAGEAEGDPEELRAALFALVLYCGDPRFGSVVGVSRPADQAGSPCRGTGLAGRGDLRQHFLVSAGLQAASSMTAASGIGELKELLDSGPQGTGFSFDDMAANRAGVRFAETLLALPRQDWPALAARLVDEAAVMPSVEGLPSGLGEAAFRERFGDVESADYRALLAEIDRRVAALPIHAAPEIN